MASTLTQLKYDDDIEYVFTDNFDMNALKCIEIEPDMLHDLQNGKFGHSTFNQFNQIPTKI